MALIAGRRPACGGCELARARGHLEQAIAELEQARLAWGVWADGVRQLAEQATGSLSRRVSPCSMIRDMRGRRV
jgi:hypothetical protein